MGRFAPEGLLRFRQAAPGSMNLTFGGAEANVAASLAQFGAPTRFVTALPQHAIADSCVSFMAGLGVDTSHIVRSAHGRLGLYFFENGINQRPATVIYDREHSSTSLTPWTSYDWDAAFMDAGTLYLTGVTAGLSETAAEATIRAATIAKSKGLSVVLDLNFRRKLWTWRPGTLPNKLAEEIVRRILPEVDILIANEGALADVFGIETDHGEDSLTKKALEAAKSFSCEFSNLSKIAMTMRENISASHNRWGALLYDKSDDTAFFAPLRGKDYEAYQIKNIVDRVGGGDSFGAGLIFALNTPELSDSAAAVSFAVAASCLCHSVVGDINYTSRSEAESLMNGCGSGRVVR